MRHMLAVSWLLAAAIGSGLGQEIAQDKVPTQPPTGPFGFSLITTPDDAPPTLMHFS